VTGERSSSTPKGRATSSKHRTEKRGKGDNTGPQSEEQPTNLPACLKWAVGNQLSVVPQRAKRRASGWAKEPLTKWARFQEETPSAYQVETWHGQYPDALWAVVTGTLSDVVALDFDGEAGRRTLARLGLPPTTGTPSDGSHVWVTGAPRPFACQPRSTDFPGMEVKAEGGLATFHGSMPDGTSYSFDRAKIVQWDELPPELQRHIAAKPHADSSSSAGKEGVRGEPPSDEWKARKLAEALAKVRDGEGRNQVGHWFVQQLWWNDCAKDTVEKWGEAFRSVVDRYDDPYESSELADTVLQVLKEPRRDPEARTEPTVTDELFAEVQAAMLTDRDGDPDASFIDDVKTEADVLKLPEPVWVVDGWVQRGGYTPFYGKAGVGKTILLTAMAKSVRRNTKWFGTAVTQGAVLYLSGEGLEQLKVRIDAYNSHDDDYAAEMDGAFLDRIFDLGSEFGVTNLIRTIRRVQEKSEQRIELVIIDPLIEYMAGDENAEGMDMISRGFRAIATIQKCAVVVGHHTNAEGETERGNKKLRARALGMAKVERINRHTIGVCADKQRNGEWLAMQLQEQRSEQSVVFVLEALLTAEAYVDERERRIEGAREQKKFARNENKIQQAKPLVLEYVRLTPGQSRSGICKRGAIGNGFGEDVLGSALDAPVASGPSLK